VHEAGLMAEAVQLAVAAAERAGAPCIERVTFAIPAGSHITAETVQTLFAALSQGTIAEGAALAVETRPTQAHCPHCGDAFPVPAESTPDEFLSCASCGIPAVPGAGAVELTLVSIEVPD
jgi:hydrogenase nickel incorporation protein HypA/HybF